MITNYYLQPFLNPVYKIYIFGTENLKGKEHLEDLAVDGSIKLSEGNRVESCALDASSSG